MEVLNNLLTNPSLETGAGDPWIPTGWSTDDLSAGDSTQELTTVHSGTSNIKVVAAAEPGFNNIGQEHSEIVEDDFYSYGGSLYWSSGDAPAIYTTNARLIDQRKLDANSDKVLNPATTTGVWEYVSGVGRRDDDTTNSNNDLAKWRTSWLDVSDYYIDDAYMVHLDNISLTVTPPDDAYYGSDAWGENEGDATFANAPTAVELLSFDARGADGAVELTWETGSEVKNLWFNLYRSTAEKGPYAKLTARPVPGLGSSPAEARYAYRDDGLANGTTYFYKLEDIETTGKTEMHGPVAATPTAGRQSPVVKSDTARITVGNPSANRWRVVSRREDELVLELVTEGFYATPQQDGTVRLEAPGFSLTEQDGRPALPVKRSWVPVVAGRKVQLASVKSFEEEVFDSLRPENAPAVVVAAGRRTVRLRRRKRRGKGLKASLTPDKAARLLQTAFQQDVKKALVEMAPFTWDAARHQLRLAHRLVVRLRLEGRDRDERVLAGGRARRYRRRKSLQGQHVISHLRLQGRPPNGLRQPRAAPHGQNLLSRNGLRPRRRRRQRRRPAARPRHRTASR